MVLCTEADTLPCRHTTQEPHTPSPLTAFHSVYVQEHEWVVQPVTVHEYRFQDMVLCTEADTLPCRHTTQEPHTPSLNSLSFCVCSGAWVGGAAGEPPGVQVPGCCALYWSGDTLSDTLHRHFTLPPFAAFHSVYVQEHEWVVQPVNLREYRFRDLVPCTEADTLPCRHTTQEPHTPPLNSLSFCVCSGGGHGWVVQPVNLQEYRFQGVVPCTEAEIHSQTHYTGTSHCPPSQPFILCMFRSMCGWCSRWTSRSTGSRTWCPALRRRYIPSYTTQALHTPPLHSLYSVYVQENEWVVQPVSIQEYRFQDMVPCTEAEIHSQTHYTGTSHSLPSQHFILCMFRSMSGWCSLWTSMSTGSRMWCPAPRRRYTPRHTTQAPHTSFLHSLSFGSYHGVYKKTRFYKKSYWSVFLFQVCWTAAIFSVGSQ